MNSFEKDLVWHQCRKKATLLIPEFALSLFANLLRKHGNTKSILIYLLNKYHKTGSQFYRNNSVSSTILYQEKGLNLHRIDFRPWEESWMNLKILALSNNMSLCRFFVMLILLEAAGALDVEESFGRVPPKFPQLSLTQTLTLYSIPYYIRNLCIRI